MNIPTDTELMLQVRAGNLDQLGILFERHHKTLYNFFLRLTSSVTASEDLVQEVFFRMLKYHQTYRGDSEYTIWMFRIARNARADYFRKKSRDSDKHDEANDSLISTEKNPGEILEAEQDIQLVKTALAQIPEQDREVLLLSRFENIKYKQIAEMLECQEGTVKARVHRALQKLKDAFFELSGDIANETR